MTKVLGSNIRFLRNKRGENQHQLALQVNKGYTTIGNWEKDVSEPNLTELLIIAKHFGVTADDLLKVDMSKGNLNDFLETDILEQKSNLTGKGIGKLTTEKGALPPGLPEKKRVPANVMQEDDVKYQVATMPRVVTINTTGEENSVFVPVKARAGYLLGYGDPEFIGTLPSYKLPGNRNKSYRIWEVDGNSMFNTLHDKDLVNAYWVRLSEIRDGRVYVLVTRTEGIIIKRVINRFEEGVLVCKSDNNHKGDYPPIILNIHDVLEVWYVDGNFTRNLAPPGEIYERVMHLEADLAIIKHKLLGKQ